MYRISSHLFYCQVEHSLMRINPNIPCQVAKHATMNISVFKNCFQQSQYLYYLSSPYLTNTIHLEKLKNNWPKGYLWKLTCSGKIGMNTRLRTCYPKMCQIPISRRKKQKERERAGSKKKTSRVHKSATSKKYNNERSCRSRVIIKLQQEVTSLFL